MNVIVDISLRNLVRQKRRNILLGIAIAFGTMILILANSFSSGISDVLFNQVMKYVSGHVSVQPYRNGNLENGFFKNGDWVFDTLDRYIPTMKSKQEAIGMMGRAIGNGVSDNLIMVGVDLENGTEEDKKESEDNFKMISGTFLDLNRSDIENPVLISESKAKTLKVKHGDIFRVRFRDMNGQYQAARITVAGVFKPANVFMSAPVFFELHTLKKLGGYGPHDIAQINVYMKNPKRDAKRLADTIQAHMKPRIGSMTGTITFNNTETPAALFGFKNDTLARRVLKENITLIAGDSTAFNRDGCIITEAMAKSMSIQLLDTCRFVYAPDSAGVLGWQRLVVKGICASGKGIPDQVVLLNDKSFYGLFNNYFHPSMRTGLAVFNPDSTASLFPALSKEYILLKRVATTDEMMKLFKEVARQKTGATVVSVQSMYESGSQILQLEYALNLITFIAVLVLFFIILIGVVNTLRMTVRERTREIGTVRAIGMQKKDVRNSFILETGFLAFFAALAGTAGAFLLMWASHFWYINSGDNPMGMLLVRGHLNFKPGIIATLGFMAFIILLSVITAYFPAKRAAELNPTEALRHYE